jgi:hypothetical protein
MTRPYTDSYMYQGALNHYSSSRQKSLSGKEMLSLCEVFGEFVVRDRGSRVVCPEFHCVVIHSDYRLVALLLADSVYTCLPIISFNI